MKLSSAAIRTRHVQLGHMTMMRPTQFAEEPPKAYERPRTYSTERYARAPSNNGIHIPQHVKERIEASAPKQEEINHPTVIPETFLSGKWGFLG